MILVTGGTGLVGSHLLFELSKTSASIRAIYRSESRIKHVEKLFEFYSKKTQNNFNNIEWVKADVLDLISLKDALIDVTQVYHCAAFVSFNKKDFSKLIKINREGTTNLVNLCLEYGIKKFGHISSTAAIGGIVGELTTEETKWKYSNRTSGYAISKYNSEREVWRGSEEGMDVIILNPSLVLGAGNWNESSLTIFKTVEKGLKFYSPGQNAFVDPRDIASVFVELMSSSIKNERFLVFSENVPFKTLLTTIAQSLNVKPPAKCPPFWLAKLTSRILGFISFFTGKPATITKETTISAYSTMEYSNEKIKKALDYKFIPVTESIKNAVEFHRFASRK